MQFGTMTINHEFADFGLKIPTWGRIWCIHNVLSIMDAEGFHHFSHSDDIHVCAGITIFAANKDCHFPIVDSAASCCYLYRSACIAGSWWTRGTLGGSDVSVDENETGAEWWEVVSNGSDGSDIVLRLVQSTDCLTVCAQACLKSVYQKCVDVCREEVRNSRQLLFIVGLEP